MRIRKNNLKYTKNVNLEINVNFVDIGIVVVDVFNDWCITVMANVDYNLFNGIMVNVLFIKVFAKSL